MGEFLKFSHLSTSQGLKCFRRTSFYTVAYKYSVDITLEILFVSKIVRSPADIKIVMRLGSEEFYALPNIMPPAMLERDQKEIY